MTTPARTGSATAHTHTKHQREITATFIGEVRCFINTRPVDGSETRVIIGEVEVKISDEGGGEIQVLTIKGEAAEGKLRCGMQYRFRGRTRPYTNKRTGQTEDQFAFDSFTVLQPAGRRAIEAYLKQAPWIGDQTAGMIWRRYGEDSVRMCREHPDDVGNAGIPRFTRSRAIEASEHLKQFEQVERCKMDLLGLLDGKGFPKKTIEKVMDVYGVAAAETIRRNPWLLMQFRGCGFLKVDKLYLDLKFSAAALKRQALCAWFAITSQSNGDTWLPRKSAADAIYKSVGGVNPRPDRAIMLALRAGMLAERVDAMGVRWLAEARKARAEDRVARYLVEAAEEWQRSLSGNHGFGWPDTAFMSLTQHQDDEVTNALQGLVSVLRGRPGTGKTYSSAEIIKALLRFFPAESIAVCAPTGKAAVRLSEAMQRAGVGITATTIHSLLKVQQAAEAGRGGDGWHFEHGEKNPLPQAFVVIDEASMIDTDLAASLLAARGTGTHFLFVGDVNQLAPVGHGAPLRDMLAAGVPAGELTKIERNSGRIVLACADMIDRKRLVVSEKLDIAETAEPKENLIITQPDTAEGQIAALSRLIEQLRTGGKFDPVWDVQVICAVNAKSQLGRKPLNKLLQDQLNPRTADNSVAGSPFRVGDKVICTKNSRFPGVISTRDDTVAEVIESEDGKHLVANGEQGEVLIVEPTRTVIRLTAPDRVVAVIRGPGRDDKDPIAPDGSDPATSGTAPAEGEDDSASASTGTGCDWELAYCISGHKSQGSEWPVVLVMVDEHGGAQRVCTRNWLYTAISRAKVFCVLIGKKHIADAMLTRDGIGRRKTFLVERMKEIGGVSVGGAGQQEAAAADDVAGSDPQWTDDIWNQVLAGVV